MRSQRAPRDCKLVDLLVLGSAPWGHGPGGGYGPPHGGGGGYGPGPGYGGVYGGTARNPFALVNSAFSWDLMLEH